MKTLPIELASIIVLFCEEPLMVMFWFIIIFVLLEPEYIPSSKVRYPPSPASKTPWAMPPLVLLSIVTLAPLTDVDKNKQIAKKIILKNIIFFDFLIFSPPHI